jgi:hypothetical protein
MQDQSNPSVAPTLPTEEELEAVRSAFSILEDEMVGNILRALGRVVNYEEEVTVTYADIGMLVTWVDMMRMIQEPLTKALDTIERVTRKDLEPIRGAGTNPFEPSITEYGSPMTEYDLQLRDAIEEAIEAAEWFTAEAAEDEDEDEDA